MNTPAGGVTLPEVKAAIDAADTAFLAAQHSGSDSAWLNYRVAKNKADGLSIAYCRAALAGEWRVPKGWKLVPVDATEAMKQAAYAQQAEFMRQLGEHCEGGVAPEDLFVLMWRAAISAAPLPKEPGR